MVDREIFSRRLEALDGYLGRIESFRATTREEFTSSPALHDLAERYLHLVMECVIDLANHWLADRRASTPETYRDSFRLLAEAGEISDDLAARLAKWAGFRNILVHEYLAIDHGLCWEAIQRDLADIREFKRWALSRLAP